MVEFTVMGKQVESIINKKTNMFFIESRRTGRIVPQSLENICERHFLFIVDTNVTQLHRQNLTYNVNKVESISAILPLVPQTRLLPTNIRENHLPTKSHSPISTTKIKAEDTSLSQQAAQLFIEYVTTNICNNVFFFLLCMYYIVKLIFYHLTSSI